MKRAVVSWSGGKDCCNALNRILAMGDYQVESLLCSVSNEFERVSIHGVRTDLLTQQAASLGIPLRIIRMGPTPSMEQYETQMREIFMGLKEEGITHIIYGDIFLEDLRTYRESLLTESGLTPVFPLWKADSRELVNDFINAGFRSIIVAAQPGLREVCGKLIDQAFLTSLDAAIDPCGEHGEFHSFVYNGPLFSREVTFTVGAVVFKPFQKSNVEGQDLPAGNWFADLISR